MKQRKIYRRSMPVNVKIKWGIVIAFSVMLAGVSYAAHTNVLYGDFSFDTSSMSFAFHDEKDVVVKMQSGSGGDVKNLSAIASYQDKKLIISDIGPINMKDLADGNASIVIEYAIKADDEDNGIMLPAEVAEDSANGYDLGIQELELLSNTPVWNLENGDKNWGSRSDGIEGTPDIVYQFLPDHLGKFHVFNELRPQLVDGYMSGTLLLKQEDIPEIPDVTEIGLSSLNLSSEVTNEINSSSVLEVRGTYGFTIPINLDQFNVDRQGGL